MNRKLMAVIRREFVTRVHTKTFLIGTILLPVMLLVFALVPMLLLGHSDHTLRIAIIDGTGSALGAQVEHALAAEKLGRGADSKPRYHVTLVPARGDVQQARERLIAETGFSRDAANAGYDGVLVLPADVLESGKPGYYGSNVSSIETMAALQSSLTSVFAASRLASAGLDPGAVSRAMRRVDLSAERVSDGKLTGQSGASAFIVAYAMGFLLYFAVLMFGTRTMTSVIEEKTSRVMEVLVSSLTPFQMLMGKVLGVGAAGLLQMAIWGVSAWLIASQATHLAGLFGIAPATVAAFAIPPIGGTLVVVFLLYFALGFLLYGALYAAVGSTCNSIQETQQYSFLVTLPILLGFMSVFAVIGDPTGTLGTVLSYVPLFAPFVMPVRWSLTSVSVANLAGSLVLMVLTVWACVWLAARIYHTGILMFGKKPTFRELWRWIRVS